MFESFSMLKLVLIALIAISVTVAVSLLFTVSSSMQRSKKRVNKFIKQGKIATPSSSDQTAAQKGSRKTSAQEIFKDIERNKLSKANKPSLKNILKQANMDISIKTFFLFSILFGTFVTFIFLVFVKQSFLFLCAVWVVFSFGLPRFFVLFLRKRRMRNFLDEFPNSIDIIVRGVKSGIPVGQTLQIIATEAAEPVRTEFAELVESQAIGLPIAESFTKLYERMPLQEVNFLAIVIQIQSQSGGSLSEALSNLANVLRARKTLKGKIQSVSQEAKSSAAIIGSLPVLVMTGLYFFTPGYLDNLFYHPTGHMMLIGSAVWMSIGVLVMSKMINFEM